MTEDEATYMDTLEAENARLRSELAQAQAERDAQQRSAKEWSDWYERAWQRGDTYRARALALLALVRRVELEANDWMVGMVSVQGEAVRWVKNFREQKDRAEAAERDLAALRAALAKSDPWTMLDPFICIHCGHAYDYTNTLGDPGNHEPDCVWLAALLPAKE